jgi:biotin-(acetyl-CoA carboxylase) ligase
MSEPTFPPLMSGHAVDPGIDPFEKACAMAALGCDAGLIVHSVTANRLAAALVMAPEVTLEQAIAMLPACAVGFQNALGALGPPELAVHLDWAGGIRVNGASCGRLRAMAGTTDPAEMPGWLVVGLEVPLMQTGAQPGEAPDRTALYDEGCAELDPVTLLESWARHTLVWINRWEDEGPRALHAEWRGLAQGIGEDIEQGGHRGTFLGVDENFGMLLREGDGKTRLIPLGTVLEESR